MIWVIQKIWEIDMNEICDEYQRAFLLCDIEIFQISWVTDNRELPRQADFQSLVDIKNNSLYTPRSLLNQLSQLAGRLTPFPTYEQQMVATLLSHLF
jgi:hypothetical protein